VANRSGGASQNPGNAESERRRKLLGLPQENLLYFLEKAAPRLQPWQREALRIVRHIAQYFYPQSQTKVMNEGTATYVHYRIMTPLHEQGRISDGNFLDSCSRTPTWCFSPISTIRAFSGFNPYALGFRDDAGHRARRLQSRRRGSGVVSRTLPGPVT
jgi:spore cortex formation protein SpoVR/YcgB (stage V sporulation)